MSGNVAVPNGIHSPIEQVMDQRDDADAVRQALSYEIRLLDQRIQLLEDARKLQALEYERRLKELNNAHARAAAKEREFLTKEVYEARLGEYLAFRDDVQRFMTNNTAVRATWTSAVAAALAALGLYISLTN